ncbi:hypothetical protein HDV01_007774 [Terramyces sp. JEL0728]|nr:hypothetical protein HDV01_007774 [Terramyces sp. JEL0728]
MGGTSMSETSVPTEPKRSHSTSKRKTSMFKPRTSKNQSFSESQSKTGVESKSGMESVVSADGSMRSRQSSVIKPAPAPLSICLKHFNILGIIGEGAFGKVKRIERKDKTRSNYALKYINKKKCIEKGATHNMFRERIVLQLLKNPFIVNLKYAFQDDENLFMVLDIAEGGDLRCHLDRLKTMKDDVLQIYTAEIGYALDYLHSNHIIHRDLKPENLLLDKDGHILLTDFNICANLKDSTPKHASGTRPYMAPEMFIGQPYGYSVDWWAVGIILYECTYGKRPYKIERDNPTEAFEVPLVFPEEVYRTKLTVAKNPIREEFYTGLLQKDIAKRLGSSNSGLGFKDDILSHSFLKGIDYALIGERKLQPSYKPNVAFSLTQTKLLNVDSALVIDELMGGGDGLAYKARKGDRPRGKSVGEKFTTGFLKLFGIEVKEKAPEEPKPKTKEELEMEEMDLHYIPYNHELPDQAPMSMPSDKKNSPEKAHFEDEESPLSEKMDDKQSRASSVDNEQPFAKAPEIDEKVVDDVIAEHPEES